MRNLVILVASFVVLVCPPARAGLLTLSDIELTLAAPTIEVTFEVPAGALPIQVLVSDVDGSFALPAGLLTLPNTFVFPSNFPATSSVPALSIRGAANQAGAFAPQNGGFGGAMPFSGSFALVPLNLSLASVPVFPLSIFGGGGKAVFTARQSVIPLPTQATATGATWTTAQRTIPFVPGITLLTTGSNTLDPVLGGQLTLVSPVRVMFNDSVLGPIFAFPPIGVGRLTLTFVPEPGTAVLFATAAFGVRLLGRRRRPQS